MTPRTIGYFTNLYPAVSHTFIRREIETLESMGWRVVRFAIRSAEKLVDARDLEERKRTSTLLPLRIGELLAAALLLFRRPWKSAVALRTAMGMAMREHRGYFRSLFSFVEALVLVRRCARLNIAHIHGHFSTNPTTVLRIAKRLGGPTFSFTNHGPAELDDPRAWSVAEKVRDATFVAAISGFGRGQLFHVCPESQWHKINVIRCGLDFSTTTSALSPVPDTNQLLCIGRLSPEKGQIILLRAAAAVVRKNVPVRVVIVGDGPLRSVLERERIRLGLERAVTLFGWADGPQVERFLLESRALVLPSLAEGLPVVLMESFRAGRPVIASSVGGIAELVAPGVSGWLVPPADEEALAKSMIEALTLPVDQLTRMGSAAYETVLRKHDVRRETTRLAELLSANGACGQSNPLHGGSSLQEAVRCSDAAPPERTATGQITKGPLPSVES